MYGIKSAIMGKTVQSVGLLLTLTKDGVKVEPQNICVPTVFICSRTLMEVWKVRKLYPTPQSPSGGYDWSRTTSVQFSRSVVSDSLRPHGLQHARPPCPSPAPRVLLKLMSIELVMPSNHLILCHPLLLPPSIFPSIRVFSNELALCIRWPKYWSFSFNISPSNEYSGLVSFRMDWLYLPNVQGTLKSLLHHHSSILRHSAFFTVQFSHS